MIDGAPRSASVYALRESKLSFVSRVTFEAFCESNPEVYQHVMILLARRLRDTDELDSIVATAADLWQADFAMIHTLEHGSFRLVARSAI